MKYLSIILLTISLSCRAQFLGILVNGEPSVTPTVITPTFSPAGGTYSAAQTVTISTLTSGATIYYTTDGSTPTTSSTVYSAPFNVSVTTTIKAIATKLSYNNSAVATVTYTITTGAARQNLIFTSTFDDASPMSNFFSPTQTCCSYSATVSTDFAYVGTHSLRFELYKTDPLVAGSSRTEVVPINGQDPLNAERWYGAAYYFPSAYYAKDGAPELITQWHHNSSTGSPPFAIWTWQDQFVVTRNDASGNATYTYLQVIPKDTWVSIVIHYKERSDASGLFEVWINGTKMYTYSGPASFSGITDYLKFGIYKWPWAEGGWGQYPSVTHRVLYIDEVRYGNASATYYDVAPGNY